MTEDASRQTADDPQKQTVPRRSLHMRLGARLRAYFFAGILITAPVSITFYIAWKFINFVDAQVSHLFPPDLLPQGWSIPGLGLVAMVVSLTLIGAVTAGIVGRLIVKLYDVIMVRMPVVSGIYSAIKQIFETVLAQKADSFREVALIEYPRPGLWTVGFITGATQGEVARHFEGEMVSVFVPTTPNPTSGFLLYLPRSDVKVLDMSVDEGFKLVVSIGIICPPDRNAAADANAALVSQIAAS